MKTRPKKTEGNTTGLTQVQEKTTQEKKNTDPTGTLPITSTVTYSGLM